MILLRQTGKQAFAEFILELVYAMVWKRHIFDGRETKKTVFGTLVIRLLKMVLLGMVLCNHH